MHGKIDKLLLNATAVSDFKKALRRKHTLRLCQVSSSHRKTSIFQRRRGVRKVRNSVININLPLMILIGMHSQVSQFHNKCLFCSIKSIYVQLPAFCSRVQPVIQMLNAQSLSSDEKSQKLYYSSQKHVKRCIESIFRMFLS